MVKMKGRIWEAIAYRQEHEKFHIFKLLFCYDNSPNPNKPYQVVTFKFVDEFQMRKCISDLKKFFGVDKLGELKNREAYVSFYTGRDDELISDAELDAISLDGNGKFFWYPMSEGISEELKNSPSIAYYE